MPPLHDKCTKMTATVDLRWPLPVVATARVVSGENMKSLFLRSGLTLACALTLAACGGSSGNLVLGGVVSGLTRDGLVLQNNGANDLTVAANAGSFVFPTLIGNDTDYNVTVKSSPPSAVCTASNNKGRTGNFDINSIVITCVTNTYDLGGTVTGLTSPGLTLINGPDRVDVPANAQTFKFAKVGDGSPYGVQILTQPAPQSCTVTNGTGVMAAGAVSNIVVACK
jgi:hypothetical protein